ncbi:MAG TPA: phosphate ABC transporter substrate-binding protein PstS [Candidatus Saccharimonadales bacterium]|nr:phosphate ABC transporter substrate-binding protein PstS [Candidatus Saccharimonadales bacterium]
MSKEPASASKARYVIIAVIIVAILVGGVAYQMMANSSNSNQTSETMMSVSSVMSSTEMSSSEMISSTMISSTLSSAMGGGGTMPATMPTVTLVGAGATFPAPLIQTWTVQFNQMYSGVTINYNPIGSGGGIQQITHKTVDFGASDAPLSDAQFALAKGLVLFPETLGGVAVTYNLATLGIPTSTPLNFTPNVITGIYNGTITRWKDPAIAAVNPGITFPDYIITAVHRSDGSGTTYAFTNYLSAVNLNWATQVGYATSVKWPVDTATNANGVGAKGNSGVAGTVAATPGAIGYVDLIYAIQNHLGVGAVLNSAGNYVVPTLQTILWAAANATGTPNPNDLRLHIVNAQGAQSYPISTYTYMLTYRDMSLNPDLTQQKAQVLAYFFWWAIHDGQNYSNDLAYVRLPANVVAADEQVLLSLNYQGAPLLPSNMAG